MAEVRLNKCPIRLPCKLGSGELGKLFGMGKNGTDGTLSLLASRYRPAGLRVFFI